MHRLVTIRFSHYNEKARWALDRCRVSYRETPWMPMFHVWGVVSATRGRGRACADRVSTRFSTPVLIADDGLVLRDSAEIVRWASERFATPETGLYPTPEVAQVEAWLHDDLGPHTRRLAYFHGLEDAALVAELARANVPPAQARLFILLRPLIQPLLKRALGVTAHRSARSATRLEAILDEVERRLDGRRFLAGDRFSAADLALACMLAPVLLVQPHEGYGGQLPPVERVPAPAAELARRTRERPAGRFALRLFADERGERQVPCHPVLGGMR